MTRAGLSRRLLRVAGLSAADWARVMGAVLALWSARRIVATGPDREVIAGLTRVEPALRGTALTPQEEAWLVRTAQALRLAAAVVPWRADCLVQAVAADRLLRHRGLQPGFHLGARVARGAGFAAHCWTECAGIPVTGQTDTRFAILLSPAPVQAY